MSVWLTETEFRESGALDLGLTLNVAFLREIKEDNIDFRELLEIIAVELASVPCPAPRDILVRLEELRDALESYFALEEFFGYFRRAKIHNALVSRNADQLQREHQSLFVQLSNVIELAEQMVYGEIEGDPPTIRSAFEQFYHDMQSHEEREMQLMARLNNEVIGVGD